MPNTLYNESLAIHEQKPAGKVALHISKPLKNQHDLALAYSPGVAAPCIEIEKNAENAFKYTAKGNTVAVITNGTAVLGLGDIGHMAAKPVMEGKCVLFKRFADVDAVDIEINTSNIDDFIQTVVNISDTWGGINLEDIKAPECFIIEQELKRRCKIPVFHDDQHGTAVITVAALINALNIANKKFSDVKIVVSGAGAAAIACLDLIVKMGAQKANIIMCDTKGVIHKNRIDGINEWKVRYASDTHCRTLEEAMINSDVFIGLSTKGIVSANMIKSMAANPIVFAMANPDPEITPDEVYSVRHDAIVATGRSDYNNQVNNVMGFPYIFRGALDVQASVINDEMKIAAAHAIAQLAKREITTEVETAYNGKIQKYGSQYIIPVPFDSRLMYEVPLAVAKAAVETGVAAKPIIDFDKYREELFLRLNSHSNILYSLQSKLQNNHKNVIFANGNKRNVIKAANHWCQNNYGDVILIGNRDIIHELNIELNDKIQIIDPNNTYLTTYAEHLYYKLQTKGYLLNDCINLLKTNNHIFAAEVLIHNHAHAMVAEICENYIKTVNNIRKVLSYEENDMIFTLNVLTNSERIVCIADSMINLNPTAEEIAYIAIQSARELSKLGYIPRVALISTATFGISSARKSIKNIQKMQNALNIMHKMNLDFEYDGEISPEIALNTYLLKSYANCKLSNAANILIMPNVDVANISSKLLQELSGYTLIGPIICGLNKQVQINNVDASSTEILNSAIIACR